MLALNPVRDAPRFEVHVGVWLLALGDVTGPREHSCHVRARLTRLVPREHAERVAELLDPETKMSDTDRKNELLAVLNVHLLPLIDGSATLDGLRTGRGRALVVRSSLLTGAAQRLLA